MPGRLDPQLKRTLKHDGPVLRVVQVTDCHLEAEFGGTLLGMDTDRSLSLVLQQLEADRSADLLLATGDLANHGSRQAYRRMRAYLDALPQPAFWLAGNHDDPQLMAEEAGDGAPLPRVIATGDWQIVLLDSTVRGEVGGTLGATELALLRAALDDAGGRHVLVCLHHHPVEIGCAWLDEQRVSDAEQLFAILDADPRVRAVLWGHVHQEFDRPRGHMRLLCTPSTCVQFAPGSEHFRTDELPPGYRWLDLYADGRIDTGVERLRGEQLDFDRDSDGYQ
jgi:Icc protein